MPKYDWTTFHPRRTTYQLNMSTHMPSQLINPHGTLGCGHITCTVMSHHCTDMERVCLPLWLLTLTWTLTSHNFCIRTMFDVSFMLLERWRWALHIVSILLVIWDGWSLIFSQPLGTSVSISDPPRPLWEFWILLDHSSPLEAFWTTKFFWLINN